MEKRKFTRFRAQDDAYAALWGDFIKIGKICDISINGLAFRYMAEEMSDKEFTSVDVFLSKNGFHLYNVPCTIVYDVIDSTSSLQAISQHRCGLKFEGIKEDQMEKLEFFLNNHTIEVLSSLKFYMHKNHREPTEMI